ncbi:MAG TPA: type II toxin-antitoxin system VapC family toxin [Dehalococcoidia bacterium]|nr:type II toxin-antitoxin system VapC family toxin [Dehalococcoidia bacterium]
MDASVVVKWYVDEIHSDRAIGLRSWPGQLIAPVLVHAELASALLKKVRLHEMRYEDARSALSSLPGYIELRSDVMMLQAFALARTRGTSLYDGIYATLALQEGCRLLTADRRLYRALAGDMPGVAVWIEDIDSV